MPFAAVLVAVATCLFIVGFKTILLIAAGLTFGAGVLAINYRHKKRSLKPAVVLLLGAVYCLSVCGFYNAKVNRDVALAGTSCTITARVVEEPETVGEASWLTLETNGKNGFDGGILGNVKVRALLFSNNAAFEAEEGDILKTEVNFVKLAEHNRKYFYGDSIFVGCEVVSAEIIGHEETLYTRCIDIRRAVRRCIDSYTKGDTAAVLKGLLMGGTDSMSDKLYSDFKICGVSHITAVSGMHIGAFCMMTVTILSFFLNRRKASFVALFPMLLSVMLAGLTPSAVRAGIMCGLTLLSNCLLKKTDSLNSLGIAVCVMLVFNPFYVCDLSFQLSCSASAGVILVSSFGNELGERIIKIQKPIISSFLKGVILVFVQSVGAVVCTLPFQIIEFGFVSIIAPLASVLICAAAVYAMTVTVIAVLFHFLPLLSMLAEYVFVVSGLIADYIRVTVTLLADIPFAYIPFGQKSTVLWLALSVATVALWMFLDRPGGKRMIALMISALLLVSMWSYNLSVDGMTEVTVLDVGDGLCVVVSHDAKCFVVGCGDDYSDRYVLRNHLKERGITEVEMLLIPSDSTVCFEGYDGVIEEISPNTVVVPENFGNSSVFEGDVLLVGDGKTISTDVGSITARAVKTKYGCVFKVSAYGKSILIGAESYDAEGLGIQDADVVVSTRALPQNSNAKITVVSVKAKLGSALNEQKKTFTAGYTVSVKFKEGKGMSVYASKE